ncbi:hypothetical protein INR49_031330 [Caranx melampygus]|nr:hypothetical protein INR49_031330 [Caranx melampygus]
MIIKKAEFRPPVKTDLTPAVEFKAAAPLFQYDREGNTKMEDPELLTRNWTFLSSVYHICANFNCLNNEKC